MLWLSHYKLYLSNSFLIFPCTLRPADGCRDGLGWNAESSSQHALSPAGTSLSLPGYLWVELIGHVHVLCSVHSPHTQTSAQCVSLSGISENCSGYELDAWNDALSNLHRKALFNDHCIWSLERHFKPFSPYHLILVLFASQTEYANPHNTSIQWNEKLPEFHCCFSSLLPPGQKPPTNRFSLCLVSARLTK